MDRYIDIQVLPDPEFTATLLMNALYAKLHRGLGQVFPEQASQIGVSFPHHDKNLGDVLRVHGSAASLNRLMALNWQEGLRDYTQFSAIEAVPEHPTFRHVRRIQSKSAHNKRMRSIRKGWLSEEQAFVEITDEQQRDLQLPYAQLQSLSNRNIMRIYIEHGALLTEPKVGTFSSYGLSAQATVPWF